MSKGRSDKNAQVQILPRIVLLSSMKRRDLFPQNAETVEYHEDRAAFVPEHSQRQRQIEKRGQHE